MPEPDPSTTRASLWVANLDAEEYWRPGPTRTLPKRILERLALFGSLFRVLARHGDALWLLAPIEKTRLPELPGIPTPHILGGQPAAILRSHRSFTVRPWAHAPPWIQEALETTTAARVNDRRFGLELARKLGVDDARTRILKNLEELQAYLQEQGASAGGWVVKAPFSASGRDRKVHLEGELQKARPTLQKLFARHGELIYEPWHARQEDLGVLFDVPLVTPPRAHRQILSAAGAVQAIELGVTLPDELHDVAERAAAELAAAGYRGPAGIDAWRHHIDGGLRWHPLGEINARWSLGRLARVAARRLEGFDEEKKPRLEVGDQPTLEAQLKRQRRGEIRLQILVDAAEKSEGIWLIADS